jgi:hypothetical protein
MDKRIIRNCYETTRESDFLLALAEARQVSPDFAAGFVRHYAEFMLRGEDDEAEPPLPKSHPLVQDAMASCGSDALKVYRTTMDAD